MSSAPIFFEFENEQSAALARETLEELGYQAGMHTEMRHPTLHIQVDHSDLTSALEIAQAHGGMLVEQTYGATESDTYAMAYEEADYIRIPAHVVNEDWEESYAAGTAVAGTEAASSADGAAGQAFDPSGEDYDYFDAGVHL